ncbi:MAG: hypothetical protein ACRCWB_11550 [Enterovibrio sp.]
MQKGIQAKLFLQAMREKAYANDVFDSATAESFIENEEGFLPEKLAEVFDACSSEDRGALRVTEAILDAAKEYERMHAMEIPADVLDHAIHMAWSTTEHAKNRILDSTSSTSDHHAPTSLQSNRAIVAIISSITEAIPFAHYLPADIKSNEAKLAILSHKAGSTFGGYSKGDLLDGTFAGQRYIGTNREHKCAASGDGKFTGKITSVQATDDTCDPAADTVPLLKGRAIVYVNGVICATETDAGGAISGIAHFEKQHSITGSIDNETGEIELTVSPAPPANTSVVVEAFIDYESAEQLTPKVITEVQVYKLFANPYRVQTVQSIDSRTQMQNELGLDSYSEGVLAIQSQFSSERHYDVLRKAKRLSESSQAEFNMSWSTQGDYKVRADIWRDLSSTLGALSQKMANETMSHGITHLYVTNTIAAQFQGLPTDIWTPSGIKERAGIYRLGRLFGKYEVYYTPKVVNEAADGSTGEILCIGQANEVTRNPFILGDAVSPMVVPLSVGMDLKQGAAFYSRSFTNVNPHAGSAKACARVNVINIK